jgi:hypothetical protein
MSHQKELEFDIQLSTGSSKLKRALLCRTGSFDGMYGPVVVDKARLEALLKKYQEVRSAPANLNDYAPVLLNHDRNVELVKGRLMPEGLEVKEWKEVDGEMQYGLFGDLRIDDPEAVKAVEQGKYAHLSISYDEDSNEIFEVSFVAVEAARGSIVLSSVTKEKVKSQGGNVDLSQKLSTLSAKHKALAAAVKQSRTKRSAALSALVQKKNAVQKEIESLEAQTRNLATTVKTAQLKARFNDIIKAGKMNPVELKAMDLAEMATWSEAQTKVLLASYENRPVSKDVFQYGQTSGEQKISLAAMTPEKMREAIRLQKAGKGASLAALEGDDDESMGEGEEKPESKDGKDEKGEKETFAMGKEEYSQALEEMSGLHSKLSECVEKMKSMGEDVEKMSSDDKDDEKKEMAAEAAPEDKPKKDEEEK